MSQHISLEISQKNVRGTIIKGKIWPNSAINKAPLIPDLLCLGKIKWWISRIFTRAVQSITCFLQASSTWNFDGGFQLIFFCKWQQLYLGLIYQKFVKNPYYSYIFNFNPGQNLNFFYGNFCLKLFKLKLKVTCYNLLFWPMANRKWSKHRFHWYMVIVMLWKDLEVPVKLEERRTFTENGGWLFITR